MLRAPHRLKEIPAMEKDINLLTRQQPFYVYSSSLQISVRKWRSKGDEKEKGMRRNMEKGQKGGIGKKGEGEKGLHK